MSEHEPVSCGRCGDDQFRVEYREGNQPHVAECVGCGYRMLLRRDGEAGSGESGRCINSGSYFEAEAGLSSQVCSRDCDRALVRDFNDHLR